MIAFMARNGISITETRNMRIDVLKSYYDELVYLLEQSGEAQEGSYDKARGVDNSINKFKSFLMGLKK